ncbi:MAG TPA: RagB/SusD family nutrient uptake outer membrane protein [Flavobacteriaceae bacterium]|nr:RagB/SusD family nutrient uptake outer membrane protein [Flavobacteriaceae bacterium]
MKKIIIKGVFLTSVLAGMMTFNSCQDALDIVQPGELNNDALFTSVSTLEGYLNGSVYASLDPTYSIYISSVLSDEVKIGSQNGGQEQGLYRHFIDGSNDYITDIWYGYYRTINRVNRLIEGAKKITPKTDAEKAKYNNVLAQARVVRAYTYLELEKYFAPDMKDEGGLGVIITPDIPLTSDAIPRSSNKEVYNVIESDLAYASSILTKGSDQYRADINVVNAIYARLNLYKGNYSEAKKYAEKVLNESGLELTQATPIKPTGSTDEIGSAAWNTAFYATSNSFNPYRKIWDDSSRGEVIFSLNRTATGIGYNIGYYFNTNQSSVTGSPMWFWGRNLFNIFYNTDGDVRRYAYVDPTSKIDPNYLTSVNPRNTDQLVIDKYPGKTSAATRNDVKVFRLSEMYFILAEVAVEENKLSEASALIQKIRVARNYKGTASTPAYTSSQVAYADILKERRVELALEGQRYTDLKRLAVKAGVTMDRNVRDAVLANETVQNLDNGSYKYTFPIPVSEFSGNKNMKQNPGY